MYGSECERLAQVNGKISRVISVGWLSYRIISCDYGLEALADQLL